jgi:hypothetical protein
MLRAYRDGSVESISWTCDGPDALKEMLATVAPHLRALGYKGSGQNFRLANHDAVAVVNFQKGKGGDGFYVNVGVQPLFELTEGDRTPDPKTIKEYECIFRQRLDPPVKALFGWPYSYSVELAEYLASRLKEHHAAFVVPLMTFPGPITEATVSTFLEQPVHPVLGRRHSLNFLHFARMALHRGDRQRAAEFASAGIEMCPERASSLLEKLMSALEQTRT